MRIGLKEVEWSGGFAGAGVELHAVFLWEMTRSQFFEHAESFESPVGSRNQRFSDFELRFGFPFKEQNAVTLFRNKCCHGTPGGSTPDNDNVVVVVIAHWFVFGRDYVFVQSLIIVVCGIPCSFKPKLLFESVR